MNQIQRLELQAQDMAIDLALFSAWFVSHPEMAERPYEEIEQAFHRFLGRLHAQIHHAN